MFNDSVVWQGKESPIVDIGKKNQISIAEAQDKLVKQRIELNDALPVESKDDVKNFIRVKIREEFKDLMKESILELIGETGIREVAAQKDHEKKDKERKIYWTKFVEDMKKREEEELLNPTLYTKEVAEMLGVARNTVHGWAKKGKLKGRHLGRCYGWAFKTNDVLAFKQSENFPRSLSEVDLADIHPELRKWYNLHKEFKKNAYLIQNFASYLGVTEDSIRKWVRKERKIPRGKIKEIKYYMDNIHISETTTTEPVKVGTANDQYFTICLLRKMGLISMSSVTIMKYVKAVLIQHKKVKVGKRMVFYIRLNHLKKLIANPPAWLKKSFKWSHACAG